MTAASLCLPEKLAAVFDGPARYRGSYGGRGSGKTRGFAKMTAVFAARAAASGQSGVILCGREFMNSLDESSMSEVKAAIDSEAWLQPFFDVGEKYIRTQGLPGRVDFRFAGLRHNLDSLKSKARILVAWIDEAENVSEAAWRKLTPTVREEGSEIWLTWNPEKTDSPTNKRFRESPPDGAKIVELNWRDNPWFPDVLEAERISDQERLDPDTYQHVWEGGYLTNSDSQVLAGKCEVRGFEVDPSWDGPYQGGDFGFAQDPTAAVRCWVGGDILYISHEAGKVGLELDHTTDFLTKRIPDFDRHVTRWDSARPESISYLKRHGLARSEAVQKWKGSVEDGIQFLRSFRRIVIHERCKETAKEARLYSYKVDRLTGEVRSDIVDAHNHYWDACVAEGQIVETDRGPIPIEDVSVGDRVLTRAGYRSVTAAAVTGRNRDVLQIKATCGTVICTPDHLVFVEGKGFIRADAVRYSDVVNGVGTWRAQRRSNGKGKPGVGGQTLANILIGATSSAAEWVASIISTVKFGRKSTVRSPQVMTSTIGMATRGTTISATSNACREGSIGRNIQLSGQAESASFRTLLVSDLFQQLGMQVKKAALNIERSARWLGSASTQNRNPASSVAEASSRANSDRPICSARTLVSQRGDDLRGWMTRFVNALRAGRTSQSTAIERPHVVAGRVLSISAAGKAERVYDLSVEGEHEFFAGGVLVHNCRYAVGPMIRKRGHYNLEALA